MTTRQILLTRLMKNLQAKTNAELMNKLQDAGLVSDNSVTLDEVPDGDLLRAYNKLMQQP